MKRITSRAVVVTAEYKVENVAPANGCDFSLEELQKIVDGYIEVVWLNNGKIMVVNEEGAFSKQPNIIATTYAQMNGGIADNDTIFGDVLRCDTDMVK